MTGFLTNLFVKNKNDLQNPQVRSAYGRLAGMVGIVCNAALCISKFIAGAISGSVSITADAVNNLTDAASSVVSMVGFRLASRPADNQHPFGHARYEYISGLVVSVFVLVIGIELGKESIAKILHPEPVSFSLPVVLVLVGAILVKLWLAAFDNKIGRTIDSGSLLAVAADCRNDVISTGAVLISILIGHFTSFNPDGWMGLLVAALILYSGVQLIKEASDPLLGCAPDPQLVEHVKNKILSYPGILGTHDLMVHDYGPGRQFASAHVEMAAEGNPLESHDIIDNIERDFWQQDQLHVVLHFDPIVTQDEEVKDMRHWLGHAVESISPDISVHDLRMVAGPTHTNLIFDCAVPPDFAMTDAQLKESIQQLVREKDPSYFCVITVETGFAALPH